LQALIFIFWILAKIKRPPVILRIYFQLVLAIGTCDEEESIFIGALDGHLELS